MRLRALKVNALPSLVVKMLFCRKCVLVLRVSAIFVFIGAARLA